MSASTGSTVILCRRYDDAPRVIDRLGEAFGFQIRSIDVEGDTVHRAPLVFASGMRMLRSTQRDSDWSGPIAEPRDLDGRTTQNPCVVVADVDAHDANATAKGAVIVQDIADQAYGGRGRSCRGAEGHLWRFGSDTPQTARPLRRMGSAQRNPLPGQGHDGFRCALPILRVR